MKKIIILLFAVLCLGIGEGKAQYKVLHYFNDTIGAKPNGSLTISADTFYGLTAFGGANAYGCIFSVKINGSSYKDLFDFN